MLYPPVSRGPRVDSQQAVSDTLHSFWGNLGAVQEADHLLDDICVPQDQTNHNTPLQTTRLHEHVEEIPESHREAQLSKTGFGFTSHFYIHYDNMTNYNTMTILWLLVTIHCNPEVMFGDGILPELHLRLVRAFVGQLHGDVLQLGLAQTQSGGVLVNHRPITIHHWAGLC